MKSPFDTVYAAATEVSKETGTNKDVDRIALLLSGLVSGAWDDHATTAARRLLDHLAEAGLRIIRDEDERNRLAEFYVTLLLEDLASPFRVRESSSVRDASRQLMRLGAANIGLTIDRREVAGLLPELLPIRATQDLETLLAGRTVEHLADVREMIRRWFMPTLLNTDHDSQRAWVRDMHRLLGVESNLTERALDTWTYRWFNLGAVSAALQSGKRMILFNNPPDGPDDRTTSFCRYVHKRVVDRAAAAAQFSAAMDAAALRDYSALKAAWPLLKLNNLHGEADYAAALKTVVMPPFHFRCRTEVQVEE